MCGLLFSNRSKQSEFIKKTANNCKKNGNKFRLTCIQNFTLKKLLYHNIQSSVLKHPKNLSEGTRTERVERIRGNFYLQ